MKTATFNATCGEDVWLQYNWQRIRSLMPGKGSEGSLVVSGPAPQAVSRTNLIDMLERRGAKVFQSHPLTLDRFASIFETLADQMAHLPWLDVRICLRRIDGYLDGVYLIRDRELNLLKPLNCNELAPLVQNQWWVKGAGVSIFYTLHLARASHHYNFKSGYHYAWLALGQVGQQLTEIATCSGLKLRMTPAIADSLACTTLMVDEETEEVAYYFKIGMER